MRQIDRTRLWAAMLFGIGAVAWLAVIIFFSAQSGEASASMSRALTQWIIRVLALKDIPVGRVEFILRKMAHFGIFAIEGVLLTGMFAFILGRPLRAAFRALWLCAVLAIGNELQQMLSVGRSCDVRDMLIDTAGAALGIIVSSLVIARIQRARRRKRLSARERFMA